MKVMLGLGATVPPAEEKNDCAGPAVSLSRQLKMRGGKSKSMTSRPDELIMSGGKSSNKTSLSAVMKM